MIRELSKIEKRYVTAIKRLFNTPDGLFVLKCWKTDYFDTTALTDDVNMTMYSLGKKEFIQELLNVVKDEMVLQQIDVNTEE